MLLTHLLRSWRSRVSPVTGGLHSSHRAPASQNGPTRGRLDPQPGTREPGKTTGPPGIPRNPGHASRLLLVSSAESYEDAVPCPGERPGEVVGVTQARGVAVPPVVVFGGRRAPALAGA